MDKSKIYKCACGNVYNQIQGLSRHRKTCDEYNNNVNESINKQTNNPMQEQLQILQECLQTHMLEKKLLQEQIQKLEFDKVQLQKQVTELQERERNMLIEQVKSLQSQLSCKTTEPSYVEKTNISEVKTSENEVKCNKKHSVKSYIATCDPITYTEFMKAYIPTIEDYSNVIQYGLEDGIIKNITTYLSKYKKENYPIVITNQQINRMRILVYDVKDETTQWTKLVSNNAIDFVENMANKFSNKLYTYMLSVFKGYYTAIDDTTHPDNKMQCSLRQILLNQLRYAENYNRKIATRIKDQFIIRDQEDDDEDCSEE